MKSGETITEKQLITEEQEHILLCIQYWEGMRDSYHDVCEGQQRAKEQLAAWKAAAVKAGLKV